MKAAVHKLSVTNFDFIVTLVAIEHLLSALVPLSNMLQAKDCDLLHAANGTGHYGSSSGKFYLPFFMINCLTNLNTFRRREMTMKSGPTCFRKWWTLLVTLTSYPPLPDVMVFNNIESPRQHVQILEEKHIFAFRRPLAGRIRNMLDAAHGWFCAQQLLPLKESFDNEGLPRESINDVYQAFHACLDVDETIFVHDCEQWRMWWTDTTLAVELPAALLSLVESIMLASKALYPSIRHCLILLMVMPVSTATAMMRRVKTYLRSMMGTERLSGLGLMKVYREKIPWTT
ncbi:hypothetical protein MAR_026490, partial [Mya arenaria]